MQVNKLVRNAVASSAALIALIVPAAKVTAQIQPNSGVRTVLLIHWAWAEASSWSKVIPGEETWPLKPHHIFALREISFGQDEVCESRPYPSASKSRVLVGLFWMS